MSRIAALLVWSISGDKQLTEELLVKLWTQCFLSGSQRDLLGSQDAREWVLNAAPSLFSKAESQLTSRSGGPTAPRDGVANDGHRRAAPPCGGRLSQSSACSLTWSLWRSACSFQLPSRLACS